eukprot:2031851-Alexandrium_andersonii.AAC.1
MAWAGGRPTKARAPPGAPRHEWEGADKDSRNMDEAVATYCRPCSGGAGGSTTEGLQGFQRCRQ